MLQCRDFVFFPFAWFHDFSGLIFKSGRPFLALLRFYDNSGINDQFQSNFFNSSTIFVRLRINQYYEQSINQSIIMIAVVVPSVFGK